MNSGALLVHSAYLFFCAGPVCSLSAKEKARGAALHLPNEGDSALHFLNEGMDDEVHTLRFLNEGADEVAVQSFTEKVKGEALALSVEKVKRRASITLRFLNEGADDVVVQSFTR